MAGENFNESGDLRSIRESVAALAAGTPATPGQKARAASLGVTLSTEDVALIDGIEALLAAAIPAGTNLIGKVNIQGNPGTLTDRSGTITSGGTAQTLAASNASRTGFMIQNQSSGDLWFSTLATAVASQPSIKIIAGQTYETPVNGFGTGAISIIGATTGQAFAAREF